MEWYITLFFISLFVIYLSLPRKKGNNFFLKNKIEEIFGADLRLLALFRIGLAILLLMELIALAPDVPTFFSDEGLFPGKLAVQYMNKWYTCIHLINGRVETQYLFFAILFTLTLFLMLGYRTRLTTFLVWILFMSMNNIIVSVLNA